MYAGLSSIDANFCQRVVLRSRDDLPMLRMYLFVLKKTRPWDQTELTHTNPNWSKSPTKVFLYFPLLLNSSIVAAITFGRLMLISTAHCSVAISYYCTSADSPKKRLNFRSIIKKPIQAEGRTHWHI